jgi:poly-gamma-glutamate synthesis protein (capsule biosynthesis protein)
MNRVALLALVVLAAACGDIVIEEPTERSTATDADTVRILVVGDVMTGRGVANLLERDPDGVFSGVRHLLNDADIVGANLESPLTVRPHMSTNENELEAGPETAVALATAGFDLMSLPNNHSTDAGPDGLVDTIDAVTNAGMLVVGAGADHNAATAPTIVDGAVTVGFLAFDATGTGLPAGTEPGVAGWDPESSVAAAEALRSEVDVLIVSVHGGTEYLPVVDPGMNAIATALAEVGVDVVWGHGAHVTQPVQVLDRSRSTVAATSLGNFLFDQAGPDRSTGAMLEVIAGNDGVVAYRVGVAEHPDRRIEFVEWLPPRAAAAWMHGSWWTLTQPPVPTVDTTTDLSGFRHGDLVGAAMGDITGDGRDDIVASFRRPHRSTPFMDLHPEVRWADAEGRSAHLGIYDPDGLREVWVAGSVLMPIADFEICDGALAIVHNQLDDPQVIAGSAWEWNGFGFDTAPDIPGPGSPACADIDADGLTEPVILRP